MEAGHNISRRAAHEAGSRMSMDAANRKRWKIFESLRWCVLVGYLRKLPRNFLLDLHTFGAFPGRPAIMRPDRFNSRRSHHYTAHGRPAIRGVCTIQKWRGPYVCSCCCLGSFVGGTDGNAS